jgi:RimJ/RimL family protein N-acetyltransferase
MREVFLDGSAILKRREAWPNSYEEEPVMDWHGAPTLETERLILRGFHESDIGDYAALNADSEVQCNVGDGVTWDGGRSWRHLAFLIGHWRLSGIGTWAVEQKGSGQFLGKIGFSCPEGWPGLELAWTLGRKWWGFGFATEGARAALAFAFDELDKDYVISLIKAANARSIRLAERLGMGLDGNEKVFGQEYLVYGIRSSVYRDKARLAERGEGRVNEAF